MSEPKQNHENVELLHPITPKNMTDGYGIDVDSDDMVIITTITKTHGTLGLRVTGVKSEKNEAHPRLDFHFKGEVYEDLEEENRFAHIEYFTGTAKLGECHTLEITWIK